MPQSRVISRPNRDGEGRRLETVAGGLDRHRRSLAVPCEKRKNGTPYVGEVFIRWRSLHFRWIVG